MKRLYLILVLMLTAVQALAATDRLPFQECKEAAARLNQGNPKTIDRDTTLAAVECAASNRGYLVTYRMAINVRKDDVPDDALSRLKPQIAEGACHDPALRPLVKQAPLAWKYYDRNQVYLGDIQVDERDCQQLGG